ncbi:MAG: hypothetical protein U5L96_05745 [Owenweeksia sp.]|nr:hypothetical protein [Owenweeksia sp.]
MARLELTLNGQKIAIQIPASYKFSDRVDGEIIHPVFITPEVVVNPAQGNLIFVDTTAQQLQLEVRALKSGSYRFMARLPGWEVKPEEWSLAFDDATDTKMVNLMIKPASVNTTTSELVIKTENGDPAQGLTEINYEHIEKRVVFEEAQVNLVRVPLKKKESVSGIFPEQVIR